MTETHIEVSPLLADGPDDARSFAAENLHGAIRAARDSGCTTHLDVGGTTIAVITPPPEHGPSEAELARPRVLAPVVDLGQVTAAAPESMADRVAAVVALLVQHRVIRLGQLGTPHIEDRTRELVTRWLKTGELPS